MRSFGRAVLLLIMTPILSASFFAVAMGQSGNIVNQKKELEKIRNEMTRSQNSLDSLKRAEKKTLKELSNYEQRVSVDETVLQRLNSQLRGIRTAIDDSKSKLDSSQAWISSSRTRYLSNLRHYYVSAKWEETGEADEITAEKDALRRLLYLKALARYDRAELTRSSDFLKEAEKEYGDLVDRAQTVGDIRDKKKREYAVLSSQKVRKERDLARLRRKKESEADRLTTLSATAQQMEDLVARLEQAREEREKSAVKSSFDYSTGEFASYKGGLMAPVPGKITKSFGWTTDNITKLKSYSPGIEISGKKNAAVTAVAQGVVAYIGNLRGYGTFVIVEHEDGYFSTYAGIENVSVEQGQRIRKGGQLGVTKSGNLKFELRRGKESLDPIEWIKIDYFQ